MDDTVENQLASRRQKKRIILNSVAAAGVVILVVVVIVILFAASTKSTGFRADSEALLKLSLTAATSSLSNASSFLDALQTSIADRRLQSAISNCKNLLGNAIYQLKNTPDETYRTYSKMSGIVSWLSASIANQKECLQGLEGTSGDLRQKAEAAIVNSTEHTSNSLALAAGIMGAMKEKTGDGGPFPYWATVWQRMFLTGVESINQAPNVTVAKDGTGQVGTIQEALNLVPDESVTPFLIYVKEGVYEEYVVVDYTKWNVYMIGDGAYKTIITGNKNVVDFVGIDIRFTATFCELLIFIYYSYVCEIF